MPVWLSADEHRVVGAVLDLLVPRNGPSPGAGEAGGADYVDGLLGAFSFDPPHIWAGGPFSGRNGGEASFEKWIPMGALEELAWRMRIEGSQGDPEREFNGPVLGWQQIYGEGLVALGDDFLGLDEAARVQRLAGTDEAFRELAFTHACEALYGDPVYGGNHDRSGWHGIGFAGDVQPRGWTDVEVEQP